jgi:hypothetical protein
MLFESRGLANAERTRENLYHEEDSHHSPATNRGSRGNWRAETIQESGQGLDNGCVSREILFGDPFAIGGREHERCVAGRRF